MDRKSLSILAVAIAVLLVLFGLADRIFPPVPVSATVQAPTNLMVARDTNGPLSRQESSNPTVSVNNTGAPTPTPAQPEVLLTVTNSDLIFDFTSRGGGIKDIKLRNTNYPAVVHSALPATDERNFATLNAGFAAFTVDDITNWAGLIERLNRQPDAVSAFLWTRMSYPEQSSLTNAYRTGVNTRQAENTIVGALNRIIRESGFYSPAVFQGVSLRADTKTLMEQNPTGPKLAYLNRLLLEDALPQVFSRSVTSNSPLPILAMIGDDWTDDDSFTLSRPATNLVRAEKTLANGLRVIKEFQVGDSGTNYLFTAKIRLENSTAKDLRAPQRFVVAGSATAIGPMDDPSTMGTMWFNGSKAVEIGASQFAHANFGCALFGSNPSTTFDDGAGDVDWVAMHSQYFTLVTIPAEPAAAVQVRSVNFLPPDPVAISPSQSALLTNVYQGYQASLVYPPVAIPPGKSVEEAFTFYAGPKEYNELAGIGHFMGNKLDKAMGFSTYLGISFSYFSEFLLISMKALHDTLGLHYGLCIIAITVIIKMVFWPLTAASTRAQKRQQALSPQLKAIAEKYKDDPLKKHEKTTALFKEHKINPLGSCLPMLITIPVFFGFYTMLRNSIELRGVPFLWAHDLTQPDTVAIISGFHLNLLPILMTLTQLWQSHLTPPSPGVDPDQQKIMRWMPLMFLMIFYRMSAGLNIYYTVSNLLTVLQTTVTKMGADPAVARGGRAVLSPQKKK